MRIEGLMRANRGAARQPFPMVLVWPIGADYSVLRASRLGGGVGAFAFPNAIAFPGMLVWLIKVFISYRAYR